MQGWTQNKSKSKSNQTGRCKPPSKPETIMSISNRIEQAPACQVINLTEAEKNVYSGSGWKLARFVNGQLVGFFDPLETEYQEDHQAMANEALENATAWIANAEGEVWLVMCSCYQLCEPRRITLTDASAMARMARAFGEATEEL